MQSEFAYDNEQQLLNYGPYPLDGLYDENLTLTAEQNLKLNKALLMLIDSNKKHKS